MAVSSLLTGRDTSALRKHCEARRTALDEKRQPWLDYCREVAKELIPTRLALLLDSNDTSTKGGQQNQNIVDGTGHLALTTVAAGVAQGAMPASSPWFGLTLRTRFGVADEVREYLDDSSEVLRGMHNQSNANHVLPEAHQEWLAFGTAAALVVEDDVDDYRLDVLTCGEYWIAEDNRGRVDTIYRSLTLTVGQLAAEFGLAQCSDHVQGQARLEQWDTPVQCIHAIEPDRDGRNPLGRNPMLPWRSVYYELTSDCTQVLAVRGYRRFPALVWRLGKVPGSAYGHGRGHEALPHLVRLRRMIYRYNQAVAQQADPSYQMPPGVQAHEVRLLPGQGTTLKGGDTVKNLRDVRLKLDELAQEMERTRQDIRDTLGSTLVASLRRIQRQMTAREADLRTSQDLTEFLPGLYRLQEELLGPYIEWLYDIAEQRGRLPQVPQELEGEVLDIEFQSPLARKQDEATVDGIVETLAIVGELTKLEPEAKDKIDFDVAVDTISAIKGAPAKMIRPMEEVEQLRQARAKQVQAQAQAVAAQQGADVAKTAAEAQAA